MMANSSLTYICGKNIFIVWTDFSKNLLNIDSAVAELQIKINFTSTVKFFYELIKKLYLNILKYHFK